MHIYFKKNNPAKFNRDDGTRPSHTIRLKWRRLRLFEDDLAPRRRRRRKQQWRRRRRQQQQQQTNKQI